MKKKILTICIIASLVIAALSFAACNDDPPAAKEGTMYQSEIESFWFGVGKAYITLDYIPEPSEPVEGEKYGYLFNVNVDAGDGYTSWLNGTWSINSKGNELTLTATWDANAENPTTLADAESGVAKSYTAKDGVFEIKVNIPSAGTITFEVSKVSESDEVIGDKEDTTPSGDDQTPSGDSDEEQTPSGDTTTSGDISDDDDTSGDVTEKTPIVTMTATDANTFMTAEIKLYEDNTFAFLLSGSEIFGGTWAYSQASNPMSPVTLTFDATGSPVVGQTATVTNTPSQDYTSFTYTCSIDYVVPDTITMHFDFVGTLSLANMGA